MQTMQLAVFGTLMIGLSFGIVIGVFLERRKNRIERRKNRNMQIS